VPDRLRAEARRPQNRAARVPSRDSSSACAAFIGALCSSPSNEVAEPPGRAPRMARRCRGRGAAERATPSHTTTRDCPLAGERSSTTQVSTTHSFDWANYRRRDSSYNRRRDVYVRSDEAYILRSEEARILRLSSFLASRYFRPNTKRFLKVLARMVGCAVSLRGGIRQPISSLWGGLLCTERVSGAAGYRGLNPRLAGGRAGVC
jgi:hypothetical protein